MPRSRIINTVLSAILVALCIVGLSLAVDYPPWWIERGVVNQQAAVNDYAAANLGQLKWIASNAYNHLEAHLPGGAGQAVHDMVSGWSKVNNYQVINLGQLKNVAKPFYDRIIEKFADNGFTVDYRWTATTADDANYAVANVGQLKNVFNFDLRGFEDDTDADGLTDAYERWIHTEVELSDTDGDGMPDGWEVARSLDPKVNDSAADPDGDGWSNLLEFKRGGDPGIPWVPDSEQQLGLILMTPTRRAN